MSCHNKIVDATDVTPSEADVIIYEGEDGKWVLSQHVRDGVLYGWNVGFVDSWQQDFDDLEQEKIDALSRYTGQPWDGIANASNISTYISYYGHSRQMHQPDFVNKLVVDDEEDDEDEDDKVSCELCQKLIYEEDGYLIPETEDDNELFICTDCLVTQYDEDMVPVWKKDDQDDDE